MKHLFFIIIFFICVINVLCSVKLSASLEPEKFQLIIKSTWHDLDCDSQKCDRFGGKWILVGSITFKKKAKEPVELNRLYLHWHGSPLDNLIGSLYTKNNDQDFMPIEDNLICDSVWNKTEQTLLLKFDEQQTLGFVNTFYLVLTIPQELEPIVKQGHFTIDRQRLPEQFKECTDNNRLCLRLDSPTGLITEIIS